MPVSYAEAGAIFRSSRADTSSGPARLGIGPSLAAVAARVCSEVGPVNVVVPGYGNDVFLPSLAGLWSIQAGYRFYGIGRIDSEWANVNESASLGKVRYLTDLGRCP